MNARERTLAIVVGGLLGVIVAGWLITRLMSSFDQRHADIERLTEELAGMQRTIRQGEAAERQLKALAEFSLPKSQEAARSQYLNWLLSTAQKVGLHNVDVTAQAGRSAKDVYYQHPFNVGARGTLEQLTKFLYEFYAVQRLQRISQMTIKPIKDSRDLDISMVLEAVSLSVAAEQFPLSTTPSDRLEKKDVSEYVKTIVGRNVLGPANNPPSLSDPGTQTAFLERPFSFNLRARDPDPGQTLTYEWVGDKPEGVELDAKSGTIRWTPQAKGEFVAQVKVADSSTPPGEAVAQLKINVVDPPPAPTPAPSFDLSRHAVLTAITEVNGDREVWVSVRTDGRLLKLREGDPLEVGNFKGTVRRIEAGLAEIEVNGQSQRIALGSTLTPSEG